MISFLRGMSRVAAAVARPLRVLTINLGSDDLPQSSSDFQNAQGSICSPKIGEELVFVGVVIVSD